MTLTDTPSAHNRLRERLDSRRRNGRLLIAGGVAASVVAVAAGLVVGVPEVGAVTHDVASIRSRRAARPRWAWALTEPVEMPSASAISASLRSR